MDSLYIKVKKLFHFGGKSYFQDMSCIKITILLGVVAGFFIGSGTDLISGIDFGNPSHYTPYRSFLNKFIIYTSPFAALLIMVLFVIFLIRSHEISSGGKVQRFLFTVFLSGLLAIPASYGWLWIIYFIAKIKSIIF